MRIFCRVMIAVLAIATLCPIPVGGEVVKQMRDRLAQADNPADSLAIMTDLFDILNRSDRIPVGMDILDLSERTGNSAAGLDIIRHLAYTYLQNDSMLKVLERRCNHFPKSPDRDMTQAYLSLRRAGNGARYSTTAVRLQRIRKAINDGFFDPSDDIYSKVTKLGSVCILLGNASNVAVLPNYVSRLEEIVADLPDDDFPVKNLVHIFAAAIYSNLGMLQESVEINKLLLKQLDDYEETMKKSGRRYFHLDYNRSLVYRSLLINYEHLSAAEIEKYYQGLQGLIFQNPDVAEEMKRSHVDGYYYMATGQYAQAIPELQKVIKETSDRFHRRKAVKMLMEASRAVGDTPLQFEAMNNYINELEHYIEQNAQTTYNEMQVLFDVNDLQARNAALELQHAEAKVATQRRVMFISIGLSIVLVIFLMTLYKLYSRARHLSKGLAISREALKHEGESLRQATQNLMEARDKVIAAEKHKSDFLRGVNREIVTPMEAIVEYSQLLVDCTDVSKKTYLQTYADMVRLNSQLFLAILNNMLDISELEASAIEIKKHPSYIKEICRDALGAIEDANVVKPGVKVVFEQEDAPDTIIITDPQRVAQAVTNLLGNAAKFTPAGEIHLSYKIDREENTVTFSVTDTGIGVPPEKSEEIFRQFVKLDSQGAGLGLGLTICRIIADLLDGHVMLDKEWHPGSRFTLTIPLS